MLRQGNKIYVIYEGWRNTSENPAQSIELHVATITKVTDKLAYLKADEHSSSLAFHCKSYFKLTDKLNTTPKAAYQEYITKKEEHLAYLLEDAEKTKALIAHASKLEQEA